MRVVTGAAMEIDTRERTMTVSFMADAAGRRLLMDKGLLEGKFCGLRKEAMQREVGFRRCLYTATESIYVVDPGFWIKKKVSMSRPYACIHTNSDMSSFVRPIRKGEPHPRKINAPCYMASPSSVLTILQSNKIPEILLLNVKW